MRIRSRRWACEAFVDRAHATPGVDGVIVVDYPPEEAAEFAALLRARGIAPIFLIAPTTPDARIERIAKLAAGYVYYVSLKGVTGAGHLDTADVARKLAEIRRHVALPVGVGFGIRDAASARAIAAHADAVVIGSRIITEIEHGAPAEAASRARCVPRGDSARARCARSCSRRPSAGRRHSMNGH